MNKRFLFILSLCIFSGFGMINRQISIINAEEIASGQLPVQANGSKVELVNISLSQIRVNPFLTAEEEELFKDLGKAVPIDYLNLSAIFYSPGASKVIINGYVLEVNNNIDGKKVIDIQPDEVILKDSEGEYVVRLRKIGDK